MTFMKTLLAGSALTVLSTAAALADPALIFDLGGKFDKSFNEAAYVGAQRWVEETGGSYRELEMQSEAQREQALRRLAETGSNPIVMTGFAFGDVLTKIAPDYPETKFVIIDMVVEAPNVQSVVFTEEEGSYLAGVMAAMSSDSGKAGFIGGMDIPLIHKFHCGFAQGFKATQPEGEVLLNFTGTTPAAWNDPVKGGELARAQISQGADVIYAAAGGTGIGVLQAAADEGALSVGVDSNQNALHPGQVLTSMVKRVDNAVFDAFTQGADLEPGIKVMDLAAGGVDVAIDGSNAELVDAEMQAAIDEAKAGIASGEIEVHDYMTDNSCPAS
ncbi:BMP family ABC transporter substrate-binding protein [Paracoccus sp. 1_MG-2023]|uniref:BMP family lipoprotein n=1 Tax=unclassified Paracoccus (in: a-proteobacteria) TaxID=2688777 RepID=UPI001C096618|nr:MULTISPECIES: BMP family ABC transporter substrate-binding protein [unclassified Paracoccus (in: a-proteobacteria)]MBU2957107.1 BMP family ABC transporter substrate-binding protein [Paracoccus sp. C2R09]MDO6669559.1 BMP family ABC transporter substrate-binding protein [Paracoccus sp. 1_MG-2023]